MSNHTVKLPRVQIMLGDIPLWVFATEGSKIQLGRYVLSQVQVTEAVEKDEMSFPHFLKGKSPEALPWKSFKANKQSVEGSNAKINVIPVDLAMAYWKKEAKVGNTKAIDIGFACAAEAIERRADYAFGVERQEEERNEQLKVRIQGKAVRRTLMDAVLDYKKRHDAELSDNNKKWMFSNVSEQINLGVFGRRPTKLCKDWNVEPGTLRDQMTVEELQLVVQLEDLTTRLIDQDELHPIECVKEAVRRLIIPVQNR